MTRYAIGLGSNEGDRLNHLRDAVEEVGRLGGGAATSALYESEPVGGPEQDPFLNAVVVLETELEPHRLLGRLHEIEQEHGRQRKVRWGPRTLDLDIVTSDTVTARSEELTIPHPRVRERAFVLLPLIDVWRDAPVGDRHTAAEALDRVDTSGVDRLSKDWLRRSPSRLPQTLVAAQFVLFIVFAIALAADGRLPQGEVTPTGVVGALVAMTGLALAFISSRRLGGAMTPSPVPREGAALVTAGPYRYARHPIYGGLILVLAGTALFLDSLWGVVTTLGVALFFWFKSGYEERQLRLRYPGYRAYRMVVTRRLIPFVV